MGVNSEAYAYRFGQGQTGGQNALAATSKNDGLREQIIESLRVKKNLEAGPAAFDFKAFKEEQYDLLAETVEANLDMKKIMEIIGDIEK